MVWDNEYYGASIVVHHNSKKHFTVGVFLIFLLLSFSYISCTIGVNSEVDV